jgi:DNA-directed RNA polymerase beta subunit
MIRLNEKPTGQNVTISFLVYTDNQEDSFIINKSSVESGLLVIDSITSESSECSKQEEMFKIPSLENFLNGIPESYLKLNKQTCLPDSVGQKFYENEALIAKIAKLDKNKNVYADKSIVNNKPDGWREVNNPLYNGDKYHYLTSEMVTRELRCCTVDGVVGNNDKLKIGCFARRKIGIAGDKFNSMNAQKGTIGRIYDSTMMPYTANGLRPDIIFNPPSIFKRKTIGQIYEPTIGKLAALLGCPIESTPYTAMRTTAEMDKLFKELGLDEYGYEDMYDPDTGKLIGKAFIGVMHYQRQQHLVENKLNVRAGDGDIDRVTQIPIKGKRRGGGQAFDVMSCKCAFASGVTNVFQDIHANQGAKTIVAFCRWCNKQFTYFDNKKKVWVCSGCGQTQDFCIKEVIPAENLINNVLCGMHVCFEYQD